VPGSRPAILDTLPRWEPAHRSTIEEVTLDSWVRGCVVLVGDAAHATSPNMAEGAAMALQDGLVLADTLRRFGVSAAALSALEQRDRSGALRRLGGPPVRSSSHPSSVP
jgi:2-polyprenyl-6-methoxyphenol hydroxylase-like FAD-dependent oxidoreductase